MRGVAVATVVVACLAFAAQAAGEERVLSHTGDSPVLAGDTVVWTERRAANENIGVVAAAPGEAPRELFRAPPGFGRMVASEDLVAGMAQGREQAVWVFHEGRLRRLEGDEYFARGCRQLAVDVDATRVAYADFDCFESGIKVRDLAGATPSRDIDAEPGVGPMGGTEVRLAGPYVAWNQQEVNGNQYGPHWLIVHDWVNQREVGRVDVSRVIADSAPRAAWIQFDLDRDGTVVFSAGGPPSKLPWDPGFGQEKAPLFAWWPASGTAPRLVPVEATGGGGAGTRLSLAGGLVALRLLNPLAVAVVDLTGHVVDIVDRERIHTSSAAFNGRRLAWEGEERFGGARLWSVVTDVFPRPPPPPPAVVDSPRVVPSTFRVASRGSAARRRRGARVRYGLRRPASSRILIERARPGRRVRGRCRRASRRLRRRRRCTRWVQAGIVSGSGALGQVEQPFSGKIGRRALRPGRYRATVLATLSRGTAARPARTAFRIVRR